MPIEVEDRRRPSADHLVHFFESDAGLIEAVNGYLSGSLLEGDAVVIIATADHRDRIRWGLAAAGVDVGEAQGSGRLQMLDAAATLQAFTVGDHLDELKFNDVVGRVVAGAQRPGRQVRAYGEMVALFWAAGDVTGAMELEGLWSELGARVPFSLFCAYPAHLFEHAAAADSYAEICQLHSHVVAGAPELGDAEARLRFPRTPHAARLARRFADRTLRGWSVPRSTVDDALLVVSEFVTNATLNGDSDVAVGLARREGHLRISVSDTSSRMPAPGLMPSESLNGRGLALVDAIAVEWGYLPVDGGKLVWAELL